MIYQSFMDFHSRLRHLTLEGIRLSQDNVRKILLEAVEEGFSSLGDSPKQAIFFHLETSFKIRKDNIPANLTEFARALEEIFGPGAFYLEKLIAKRLSEKLGLEFEEVENWDFLEYVGNVKKHLPVEREV
jgi:hypothetical protein